MELLVNHFLEGESADSILTACYHGHSDKPSGPTVLSHGLWLTSLPFGGALYASGLREYAKRVIEAA
jgi:hypothetical protein